MSLLDTNSDELIQAAEQAPPPQRREPPKRFSAWSLLAPVKGVAAGAAEGAGSTSDILGAFGQVMATTGASSKGMFAVQTPEEKKQTNEATDKLLNSGIDYNSEAGRLFRNVSADYTPDPQTAHVAESAVFNLFRVGSKALTSAATMGNIPGAVVAGLEEGFTQSDQLGQQGVDLATRSKVGTVTALTNALGFALPVAGATWKSTAALAVAGGPASFIAQNAATREILQAADYSKLADQYDPLDPVGLALSTLLPLGFGAWAMRRAKAKPGVEDKGPMPDGTSPDIKAPATADTAQPATKGIANVQDAQAPAGTKAQATPDQAGTNAEGNATPPTDVPGTGAADVQANGVAPKQGPGAPLANGFFAGPVEGEKFRVSDVSATGGLTLDKRLKAGTASTMYVGVDGGFIDANNVNLIGDGASKIWKPITDAARNAAREILQEMGTLPLGNKRREELKAKLKEVVANDGTPPPDTVPPKAYHPPADLVDAARVNLVREHMDATNPKPGDLEAADAHSKAYKQAMEQQAEGRPVNIMDVAPKIEPIAGKATDTPNFKAWFGDSKVVDDTGAPMVVYHGTGADTGSEFLPGSYFSPRPDVADIYATAPTRQVDGGAPNVTAVYLALQNPYVHDDIGSGENLSHAVLGRRGSLAQVREKLASEGYDGIVIKNYLDLGGIQDQYVAFRPEQVKSAIGNNGDFDPNSASLTDNPIADWGAGLTKALDDMAAERAKLQPKPAPALADTAQAAIKTVADQTPDLATFITAKGLDAPAAPVDPKAAKGNAFIAWLKDAGGVAWSQKTDIVGERGVRGNYAGIFTKKGQNLDTLVESAVQAGYLTRADLEASGDVGGTRALSELIRRATTGEKIATVENADAARIAQGQARAAMDAVDAMERELKALGVDTSAARGNADALGAYLAEHRTELVNKKLSDIDAETRAERIETGEAYNLNPKQIDAQARIALAEELDENAMHQAAMVARDEVDFLNRIEEIINNAPGSRKTIEGGPGSAADASVPARDGQAATDPAASTSGSNQADTTGSNAGAVDSAAAVSPVAARLDDISYRNPTALDAEIKLDDGKTMTARDFLEMVKREAAQDTADADLLEVAANCFLSGGL